MWSSIEQIIKPDSLNEALILQKETGAILFAGGSYLVAQKDLSIRTLIDINHLLDAEIAEDQSALLVGAACTLQELLQAAGPGLAKAITAACPSKNIRNQRTLGGEIAQARPDSDLLVYLHAADAQLQLNDADDLIQLTDWERAGIITAIQIPLDDTILERVTVLDSAPAFVIVAVHQTAEQLTLAIGGKAARILSLKTPPAPDEAQIRTLMDKVEALFTEDHFDSPAYKRQLVSNLLTEMVVTI
jgi:CO/xanthine dehydrogenase FAD-binding subunit